MGVLKCMGPQGTLLAHNFVKSKTAAILQTNVMFRDAQFSLLYLQTETEVQKGS
jgi:hypothetical protein